MVHLKNPLIVVSNRLPFVVKKNPNTGEYERRQSASGLVTAVAPVVVDTGGLWVGWPGIHTSDSDTKLVIPESDANDKSPTAGLKSKQALPVVVDHEEFDDYYNGTCNAIFWPLFHSMPDRADFKSEKYNAYKRVNKNFADMTVKAVRQCIRDDPTCIPLVWIHDYHLMLVANDVRKTCYQEGLNVKIAFFLHIPFPARDIMRLFPWDDEILQGIMNCDSVGFHIKDYCLNFIDCCNRSLNCRVDRENMLVEHPNNVGIVSIHALPISIPYERFENLARVAPAIVKNNEKEQILLGVDRLDYTKGLVNRIKAFERLLEKHPEHLNHVTFLQVAVPSRTDVKEYQDLKTEVDQLIGQVNGRFSNPNWSPIRYIYGCISQEELSAFYRDASVAVVAPLRDGMNLVAKEFVACQTAEPGVLILSKFAGAESTMKQALKVNPFETNEFADQMHRALTLDKDERELRMNQLRHREKIHDVNFWLHEFLKSVDCIDRIETNPSSLQPLSKNAFDCFLSNYVTETSSLALLLDYDGTLAPIVSHPDLAYMPEETRVVLTKLAQMPDVNIAIISGRSLESLKNMVGIDGITYAGNHGFNILHPDGYMFSHAVPHDYEVKLQKLKEKLMKEVCRDDAWLEDKGQVIAFHYGEVSANLVEEIKAKTSGVATNY